jgi:uncharacterized membrane protein YjfL (UPF0719 family)
MKTLHIPHFFGYFLKLIFTIFYKIIYNNILQYDNFFFISSENICSMLRIVIVSFLPLN